MNNTIKVSLYAQKYMLWIKYTTILSLIVMNAYIWAMMIFNGGVMTFDMVSHGEYWIETILITLFTIIVLYYVIKDMCREKKELSGGVLYEKEDV